jgi:hypothetical protein
MLRISHGLYNAAIVVSVFSVVVARLYDQHIDSIISDTFNPIVSVDVDRDGKPDIERIKGTHVTVWNMTFPVGHIAYNIAMFSIKLLVIYWLSNKLIRYTRRKAR